MNLPQDLAVCSCCPWSCCWQVAAVYHGMLDQQLMQVLRAQQKFVVAWTVDEPGAIAHMLDLAVDGVVTNAPALLKTKIEAALLQCTREL